MDPLRFCIEKKGLNVYAYCLMTNHLHLIANCNGPFQLRDAIRDFKGHSARMVLGQILNGPGSRRENPVAMFKDAAKNHSKSKAFKFWKTGNHAMALYTEKFLWDKINYIHNNPVSENFVAKPGHWLYSSASNYLESASILDEVTVLPQMMKTIRQQTDFPQQYNYCGAGRVTWPR